MKTHWFPKGPYTAFSISNVRLSDFVTDSLKPSLICSSDMRRQQILATQTLQRIAASWPNRDLDQILPINQQPAERPS